MISGKKTVAEAQVYAAIELLKKQTNREGLEVLEEALRNITPQMEVRSRRVGGAAYQVPTPVKAGRGSSLAIRWLILEANKRPNKEFKTFSQKLSAEILDALNETGGAIQKKINAHKMADANKAFAHFRW
jgi:small subunit ribosomal protein S7